VGSARTYLTNATVLLVRQICWNFLTLFEGIVLNGVGCQPERLVNLKEQKGIRPVVIPDYTGT
jgi:hypothetical protein